jgi:hypothetical protein
MLTTRVVDDGDGYVAYVVRCDEHGMAGSYSEQPYEDRYARGPMRHISADIHLLVESHPTPPEPWYARHEECRWFDGRPCWLNGGGHTNRPLSPQYGLIRAAEMLTCGCIPLDLPAIPARRYHESVLRHALGQIEEIAKQHDLTVAEISDYLVKEK